MQKYINEPAAFIDELAEARTKKKTIWLHAWTGIGALRDMRRAQRFFDMKNAAHKDKNEHNQNYSVYDSETKEEVYQ